MSDDGSFRKDREVTSLLPTTCLALDPELVSLVKM